MSDRRERVLDDVVLERGEHLDALLVRLHVAAPRRASRGREGAARRTAPRAAGSAGTGGVRSGTATRCTLSLARAASVGRSAGSSAQASSGSRPTSSRTARRTSSGSRPCLVAPAVVERRLDRVPQRRLLLDLAHGATPRVHVRRRLPDDVAAEVVETVTPGRLALRVALARPEDAVEARAGGLHQLLEVGVHGDVEVAEQDQARGQPRAGRVGVGGNHHQPREVDAVEGAEVDHRPVRDAVAHALRGGSRRHPRRPRVPARRSSGSAGRASQPLAAFTDRSRARSGAPCPSSSTRARGRGRERPRGSRRAPSARGTTSSSSRGRSSPSPSNQLASL